MAAHVRAFDWASTPLEARDCWPAALNAVVDLMLATPQMATLAVGPERIFLYNDEAAGHYGASHPAALGRPLSHTFPGEFERVAAFYDRVFAGESVHVPAQPLDLTRTGTPEVFDAYLTPVRDDRGEVVAVYMTGTAMAPRMRAEAALRDSEARLRALVLAGAVTIYRMSPDWRQMYQLDSRDFLATTPEPIEDWTDSYILPDDRPMVLAAIEAAIQSRSTFELEHRVRLEDGGVGWVSSRAVPMLDPDGEIVEWFGAGTDITERKRAETALSRTEEQYRTLFEAVAQGVCVIERIPPDASGRVDFRYVAVNAAFEEQTGLYDVAGRTLREVIPGVEQHIIDSYDAVARTGEPWRFETHVAELDLWFDGEAVRAERPDRIAVLFSDITDRKRAEIALRESEKRQAFLLKLGDATRGGEDADSVIAAATRMLGEHLGASRIVFAEIDDAAGFATIRSGFTADGARQHPAVLRLEDFGGPLLDDLRAGQTVRYDEVGAAPFARPDLAALAAIDVQAGLSVPLLSAGRFVVNLNVHQHEPRAWTDAEVALVEEVAERIWAAVQRARAETALAESEDLRRIAVEGGGMGTWRWDLRAQLIWGDAAFLSLWGFPPSDEPRPLADFAGRMSPQGQAEMGEMVTRAIEAGEVFDGQLAVVSGPTGGHWVRWRGRADRERPWKVNGVSFDITDQRARDEQLRDSEERFRALATTSAFSIYRMSPDWRLMYQLHGGTLASTVDPIEDWVEKYIPDDDLPAVRDAIGHAIRTKSMFELEHRVRLADGGIGWVLSRAVPLLDGQGEIAEWFGSGSDVTERREAVEALRASEIRYQALFAASPVPFMVLDANPPDFTITAANEAYFAATLTTPETLIGRRLFDVFTDDPDRPGQLGSEALAISLDKVLTTKRADAMARVRYDLVTPGGFEPHWWLATNAPLLGAAGDITAIIHQVDRQTELHYAEEAARSNEERQAFLLKLSDAMRTVVGVDAVGRLAAGMIADALALDRVYFVTADLDDDRIEVTHDVSRTDMPPMLGRYRNSDFPDALQEFLERPIMYTDVRTDSRLSELDRQSFEGLGAAGFAAVPIRRGEGTLIWAIGAVSTRPREWPAGDISLLEEAAERTWAAIERARADAALRASEQALAADLAGTSLLRELADRLVTEEDLATIHEQILSAAMTITGADAGTVQIFEPATQSLTLLVTHGFEPSMTDRFRSIDADSRTACGSALKEGRRTYMDFDADEPDETARLHLEAGYRSAQATPLLSRAGAPLGMLNTHWRASRHRPSERELHFLDLLARQAADLIERAQAQQRLRESEERLRQFGEASQDVLWIRDAETLQWTYLTPAFETIYGLGRKEALSGDNYRNWQELIVPEDRELAVASIDRVRAGESITFEYRVRRPRDGAMRWLRNTDFPITDAAGHVVLIGGIGTDFTEVREAELRLQTLVEGMPQLVWRAVDGGEWTWANTQWTAYTGQSEVDLVGWGWLAALHPDDRADARAAWTDAHEQGGFTVEYRLLRVIDGGYRWFQTRAAPVRDKAGSIVEWLGTSTDVNDLREMQERQGVMVAELQHRTRNLITVVRSLSERTSGNATSIDDFRARFNQRLSALSRVQGLLSHLSAGQRVTFDELLRSELGALGALEANGDKVTLEGPSGVRLRSATVQTFALALHELATNAVKYGALAVEGGHLTVCWRVVLAADGGEPRLQADWRESGVTLTEVGAGPRGGGYGRELIERALPYQLKARTTYELTPEGVHCTIDVPISRT